MNKIDLNKLETETISTEDLTEKARILREMIHDLNCELMQELVENNDMVALTAVAAITVNIWATLNVILSAINFDEQITADDFREFLVTMFKANMASSVVRVSNETSN